MFESASYLLIFLVNFQTFLVWFVTNSSLSCLGDKAQYSLANIYLLGLKVPFGQGCS